MSSLFFFIKAWTIGMAVAAPIGPIGMLFIQNSLKYGFRGSIAVALGAASADSFYGMIAAIGLSSVTHFLVSEAKYIKIIGGILLLFLAFRELNRDHSNNNAHETRSDSYVLMSVEVFFLTLTNPMTILPFIGIFASLGTGPKNFPESFAMVLGIFLGCLSWWSILGTIILKMRQKLSQNWIKKIKYSSVCILIFFGLYAISSGLFCNR